MYEEVWEVFPLQGGPVQLNSMQSRKFEIIKTIEDGLTGMVTRMFADQHGGTHMEKPAKRIQWSKSEEILQAATGDNNISVTTSWLKDTERPNVETEGAAEGLDVVRRPTSHRWNSLVPHSTGMHWWLARDARDGINSNMDIRTGSDIRGWGPNQGLQGQHTLEDEQHEAKPYKKKKKKGQHTIRKAAKGLNNGLKTNPHQCMIASLQLSPSNISGPLPGCMTEGRWTEKTPVI
ncbi:hypothetical protein DFH07DRAFT_775958 [Mycena maculata]|uniref:Uncharacterized protein n=1 Tax=Mycena maculata TaxID=230809 RepID=A0AAD7IRD3_9AGAR|nr:hypothetical protein DFH07DRAFT_775958 [Mycena maculata]